MTCCFTGAVLVFEKELQESFHHSRYYVKQQNLHLPIQQLIGSVKQKFPAAKISSVKLYPDPERSVEIGVSLPEKGNDRKKQSEQQAGNEIKKTSPSKGIQEKRTPLAGLAARATHTVFINPYTAEILELYNYRETFFYSMFSLHRWLLGSDSSIGKTITGISTLIFLFILITGIILWWPRNKAILIRRLKIKGNASLKRLNHDLHIVLGFYSAIFLFIFAFTALAWSFKWFNDGIYKVTGSSQKPAEPIHSIFQQDKERINYDVAFVAISDIVSDAQYYTLRAPSDSTGTFTATVLPLNAHESSADNYYIDQYSGQVIGSLKFQDKNLGQRVRSTFKPVHTGSIYGFPSKIIAFLVCLFGVSFPITGTIMWLNRLKKNKRRGAVLKKESPVLVDEEDYE